MFEQILRKVSPLTLFVWAVGAYVLWSVATWYGKERRIQQLGGHAPRRQAKLPFSVDLMYEGIKYALSDDNLKLWHMAFMSTGHAKNPYTIEMEVLKGRIVLTADPENVKAILATQFHDFGKGPQFNTEWHEFLGNSIFSTDGRIWHDSRQLVRTQFVKERISDLEIFERHTQVLMSLMGGQGQTVDVKDLFFRFTLDAVTDFLFGRSIDSLHKPNNDFAEAFAGIQHTQSLVSRAGQLRFFLKNRKFHRQIKILNNFLQPYIDEALALPPEQLEKQSNSEGGHRYTFLHAIAAYTRDPVVLRDQLLAMLLAGRDTTATTLSWLFFELGRKSAITEKLRREILDTVGPKREPTYADLKKMRYLQHCLQEILRIYPAVPFNVRVSLKDTTLPHGGGPDGNSPMGVLEGTPIGYSTQYMQLRDDMYSEMPSRLPPPHVFAPERWESWQPKNWTYIPFNGGPRICVGQQFALTEMAYVVVRILQRFTRVESRIPAAPSAEETDQKSGRFWMRRTTDASTQERLVGETKDLGLRSEIILSPVVGVNTAFFEA